MLTKQYKNYGYLMRWHKPVGIGLLLWPTLWALWLATGERPSWHLLIVFISGVCLMRPAGCIVNDLWDRHIDKNVARTQDRPLATGVVSVKEAILLFGLLCALAAQLLWFLPPICTFFAVTALFFSSLYPLAKRVIIFPQLILGLSWYLSIPMAYGAVLGYVPTIAWWVYSAGVAWTLAFDTIYAMADVEDDQALGLGSTALGLGRYATVGVSVCFLIMLSLLYKIGLYYQLDKWYNGSLLIAVGCIGYQLKLIQNKAFIRAFKANQWLGFFILIGIILAQ